MYVIDRKSQVLVFISTVRKLYFVRYYMNKTMNGLIINKYRSNERSLWKLSFLDVSVKSNCIYSTIQWNYIIWLNMLSKVFLITKFWCQLYTIFLYGISLHPFLLLLLAAFWLSFIWHCVNETWVIAKTFYIVTKKT